MQGRGNIVSVPNVNPLAPAGPAKRINIYVQKGETYAYFESHEKKRRLKREKPEDNSCKRGTV